MHLSKTMNKYTLSNGLKIDKSAIDRNIRKAKEQKLAEHYDEYGQYVCTKCNRNDCIPITVSHIESVDSCQKNGRAEKAWDTNNMQILGMKCHKKYDGLDLRFNNDK